MSLTVLEETVAGLVRRMTRIETRLCQLMLHMGLDPYNKQYDADEVPIPPKKEKPG